MRAFQLARCTSVKNFSLDGFGAQMAARRGSITQKRHFAASLPKSFHMHFHDSAQGDFTGWARVLHA